MALLLLVRGRRIAFATFDGEHGRCACMAFVKKHGGRASPISQDTLRHLGLELCLMTDLSATNGGSIFLLFVHGLMILVLLRPSVGSYAFLEYQRHGRRGLVSPTPPRVLAPPCPALTLATHPSRHARWQMAALKPVHNQTVLLGKLMGIEVPPFIWDESPLPLLFEAKHQEEVTKVLHDLNWLHPDHIYRTPGSNGGKAGGKASAALAGTFSEKLGRDRMTMPERGHEGVLLAGTFSEALGRDRMTMPERSREGVRLAGTFSEALGRDRMTLPERGREGARESARLAGTFSEALGRDRKSLWERPTTLAELWVVFKHRASTELPFGPWMGTRHVYSDGGLDGISRWALATRACQMSRHGHSGAAACAI